MYSHRSQLLALALLVLCSIAAALLAGVAAMGMTLKPPVAVGALALSAVLVTGVVVLHKALREARWDAGYRLR
jgi:Cu/Ag efflux pump CusA